MVLVVVISIVVLWTVVRSFAAANAPNVVAGGVDPRGFRPQIVDAGTGDAVRFDACTPIHYVINPANAPSGGMEDVHTAFELTARATGLSFVYEGESSEIYSLDREPYQPDRYGDRWAPVLVTWTSGSPTGAAAAETGEADPIGVGGSAYVGNGSGKPVYVTGAATFDATTRLRSGFGGETWGQVILHELGHIVGLGHVDDSASVMNPVLGLRPAAWGPGDRAGLWQLGIGAPCLKAPSAP